MSISTSRVLLCLNLGLSLSIGVCLPVAANATNTLKPDIQKFLSQSSGQAVFHCAFKGTIAQRPCLVRLENKRVRHPLVNGLYGPSARVQVMTIVWPDGDQSNYVAVDSLEVVNLAEQSGNYRISTGQTDMEVDWSRGYVIEKDGREWVRLW